MCGIFGLTGFNESVLGNARRALNTLEHRGPDQWNDYFDEDIYIGHRRLSILDLSEQGRQPMMNQDGTVIITVNGEIYNYKKLKDELKTTCEFQSSSDSEVILHGYIEWGIEGLLEKIDGMYAFSIYDKKKGRLYLVRDRVGIKPLFYSKIKNQISYASELKAIANFYSGNYLETDYTSLYDFLTYKYIPAPKTMYRNVFKLEPGHYLTIDLKTNSVANHQYWNLNIGQSGDDINQAKKEIARLIKKSVNEQMMSDVPVGFFLSGGLDSSAVVAMAAESNAQINTFSIGFSEKVHDETEFADIVAREFKTNHQKKILDQNKTSKLIPSIKEWYDEPFADFSCFPTFLVSAFARESVTVVLSGDGGDELFGGYNWYKTFVRKSRYRFPKLSLLRNILNLVSKKSLFLNKISRRIVQPYLLNDLEFYTKLMGGLMKSEKVHYKAKWAIPDDYDDYWYFRKYYRTDLDIYTRLQYLDFHTYLPDDILTKVDRVSMRVSLECRVPLLSKELIEYLFSLSPDVRMYKNELKGAMKQAMKEILPDEILNRDKKGFSIPYYKWKRETFNNERSRQEFVLNNFYEMK